MAENIVVYTVRVNTENGKVKIDGLTKGFVSAKTAVKNLNTELLTVNDSLDKNRDKTGLAGAAVVEIGRTISDSNYGFQAMANNISQVATLMTTLIATSGGVRGGLRELGKAFAGPLGIIVLFQVAIALLEKFSMNSKNTETSLNNIEKAAGSAGTKLTILKKSIEDNNISLKEKEKAIAAANKEYKDLNLQLDENGQLTKDSTTAIDNKIEALKRLAKANAYLKELEKLYGELALSATKTDSEFVSTANNIGKILGQLGQTGGLVDVMIGTEQENREKIQQQINALLKAIGDQNLVDDIIGGDEKTLTDKLAAFLEKFRKKRIEAETKTKLELLKVQEDFAIKEAKALGATQEQLIDIIKYYQIKRTEIEVAGLEARFKALALSTKKAREKAIKDSAAELKRTNTAFSEFAAKRTQEIYNEEQNAIRVEEKRQERLDKQIAVAQAVGAAVTGIADNIDAAYQKEIDIEQNKTTAINNELRQRLANENLSADERRSIQDKIARNDEALRVKQEAIEKKRFKANKTAAIAEATVNTFLAATGVLKSTEGGSIQRIAGMIAVIGAGLAQVAMISKQQFVSSQSSLSGSGAGTSGTGGGVQAPEFNIVGASSARQLADVVEGQLNRPIKTYVVSSDVSTAQSLERNIVEGASI
jgi:hypothetical protein